MHAIHWTDPLDLWTSTRLLLLTSSWCHQTSWSTVNRDARSISGPRLTLNGFSKTTKVQSLGFLKRRSLGQLATTRPLCKGHQGILSLWIINSTVEREEEMCTYIDAMFGIGTIVFARSREKNRCVEFFAVQYQSFG